ncbi:MAG: peptidoglycan/LPS O-acetylase OafA/YrhL [Francisellaceae bacterium]|jgi:peptidoglycan/LPS O-acetylase OafA/YrhL
MTNGGGGYRSDIDGLRALAVLAVVIYHFFPNFLVLGYLGVDIFFVISGYLITKHLLENDNRHFPSYLKIFYSKRIKRLFPALFVFLFISSFCVSILYLKPDLHSYFKSLVATKTLWANWFFWRDGGYFGGNDQLKPLLHMWSLSVEEQFYIIYPSFMFILLVTVNKFKNGVLFGIITVTFLSFCLWLYLNRIGGSVPAFFLMPTRAWQFGLGAIFSFFHYKKYFSKFSFNSGTSYFSISLISFGLLISISQVINTLIVTFGAGLFVFSLNQNNSLFNFFSSKIAIFLGKISYSFYLYHWLVAVLLLYVLVEEPSFLLSSIGVLLSITLGWLSFKYIEIPFRFKLPFKSTVFLTTFLSAISLGGLLIVIDNKSYDEASLLAENSGTHYRCSIDMYIPYGGSRACKIGDSLGDRDVVLMGNSHAQMYAPIVNDILLKGKKNGYLIPLNGCLPTTSLNISKNCIDLAKINFDTVISDKNIKTVIIASTWYLDSYIDADGNKIKQADMGYSFLTLINDLQKSGKNVALISPIKIPTSDLASKLPRLLKFGHIEESYLNESLRSLRSDYDNKFININSLFKFHLSAHYIEAYRDLCDEEHCYYGRGHNMYFADSHHLSQNIVDKLKLTKAQLENVINISD